MEQIRKLFVLFKCFTSSKMLLLSFFRRAFLICAFDNWDGGSYRTVEVKEDYIIKLLRHSLNLQNKSLNFQADERIFTPDFNTRQDLFIILSVLCQHYAESSFDFMWFLVAYNLAWLHLVFLAPVIPDACIKLIFVHGVSQNPSFL